MNKHKLASVALSVATLLVMVGAPLANAQTTSSLQAQIAALLAQIQTLQSQLGTSSTASTGATYDFTSDLTVGSTGAQVTALQQFLIAKGDLVLATPTTYFGPLTQAALAKFQAANGITPSVGYFGPKTRAFINSMSTVTPPNGTSTVTVPTGTPLSIAIDPQTPGSQNLANGAVNTPVLKLDFTAGATPVTVTNLVLNRVGLSQDSDLDNVYLYQNGVKLASDLGFNQGAITFSNGAGLFTVPANSTAVITVSVDVDKAAGTGHIFQIGLESASNVTGGTFTGNFPMNSASFTVANITNLATLTIPAVTSSTITVNAGQTGELVGQFNMQAGNNAVAVNQINFTVVGSIPTGALQNVKLMNGSTQLGATIPSLGTGEDVASFNLSNAPLQLTSGQSVVLSIYADVTSGVNRTFQFSLQQSSDVQAKDLIYSVGIGASSPNAGVTSGFPINFYNVDINNGGLVISKDAATPTTNVVAGNTNQVLAKFDVLASGDSVKFNELDFQLTGSQAINNFRVVDDQGAQIGSTVNVATSAVSVAEGSGSLNYIIPANTTRVLTVYGDLPSTDSGSLSVTLGGGGSSAQDYSTFSTIGVSQTGANTLTILGAGSNLTAAENYSLGTPVSAPAGQSGVEIGSYTFTAGQVNPISLTGITIQTANNGTWAGYLRNLRLMNGTTQVGQTYSTVAANAAYSFNSNAPISIAANNSVTLNVFADIASSLTPTTTTGGMTSLVGSSVNASTLSGNAVTVNNVTGQNVTFTNGGVLTGQLSAGTTQAAYVGMNVAGVEVGQYQFTADNNGNETLTQLNFTDSSSSTIVATSTHYSDFGNYRLTDTSGNVLATAPETASGTLSFSLSGLNIPVNSTAYVDLVADTNPYPYPTSGDNHAFALTSYQYTNASQATTTPVTTNNIGNLFTVYQTTLSVAGTSPWVSGTTLPNSASGVNNIVGEFSFTAGSGGINPVVKTVKLSVAGSLIQTSSTQVLGLYDSTAPSTLLASTTVNGTTVATFNMTTLNNNQWTIPAGFTRYLYVKQLGASNFAAQSNSNGSYQVLLQGVQWSDGTAATGVATTTSSTWIQSLSPSISIPVASQNITGLNN